MNYSQAKARQTELYQAEKEAGDRLKAIPGVGSGPMGLTPDSVKASPEYRKAKADYDLAFANLRSFNSWFTRTFKKEIRQERRDRS